MDELDDSMKVEEESLDDNVDEVTRIDQQYVFNLEQMLGLG